MRRRVEAVRPAWRCGSGGPWSSHDGHDGGGDWIGGRLVAWVRTDPDTLSVVHEGAVALLALLMGTVPGVVSGGESGLHGLALLPTGDTPMLFAYFGAADDNRVVRMPLDGEPGSFELGEPEVVLDGIPRANTHDGGRLAFGPDGSLYVTTGDAQQRDAAQDPDALGGKILRITADGAPAPGNPRGTRVWSRGRRFGRTSGRMKRAG